MSEITPLRIPTTSRTAPNRPHPINHLLLGAVPFLPSLPAEGVEFAVVLVAERNDQHVGDRAAAHPPSFIRGTTSNFPSTPPLPTSRGLSFGDRDGCGCWDGWHSSGIACGMRGALREASLAQRALAAMRAASSFFQSVGDVSLNRGQSACAASRLYPRRSIA